MKAFAFDRYGGPEVATLRDMPHPVPSDGEVLVKVHAAGLNPLDFKIRKGMLKVVQRYPFPAILGNEFAGTVEAVGPGVTGFVVGDRVYARTANDAMGAFAQHAVAPEHVLAIMPSSIDFPTAAGVPLAALTALQALRDELQLGPGRRVFIPGGAGGVGTFAIQIAKWLGARVITTASPRGKALVERMGADEVIDYTSERFEDHIREVDAAFDLIGGNTLNRTFAVVKRGGTVVSLAAMPEPQTALKDLDRGFPLAALFWFTSLPLRVRARMHGVRYRFLFMHPSGAELKELAQMIDSGVITPVIDKVFPFDEIEQAFAYLEAGHAKGKVVVQMEK